MEEKKLTQFALMERGWTKKLISDFLPEPEIKSNPFRRSGPPMKLWSVPDVEQAEKTEAFQHAKEESGKRKLSAKKGAATKADKLMAEIDRAITEIKVREIPDDELRHRAWSAKSQWCEKQPDPIHLCSAEVIGEATMARWIVNYIRHNLTKYDKTIYETSGKVGARAAYVKYKTAVLCKIAEIYPKYKEECQKQVNAIVGDILV